jgi:hypothetical protein
MTVADTTPAAEIRSKAPKLAGLGALSGAVAWALINYAKPLGIDFDVESGGVVLLPIGIYPGLIFGIAFSVLFSWLRRAAALRAVGYIIASLVGYAAAFHVAFYILGNLDHDNDSPIIPYVVSGVPAALVGSTLLSLATKLLFRYPGYRFFWRSVIVGTLAGALLCLGSIDDHNGLGFLAFFVLWQGAYGACLAPLLKRGA